MKAQVGALALLWVACAGVAGASAQEANPHLGIPEGGGPVDVGAIPAGLESVEARACAECHASEYRQWRRSAHRHAFDNPVFQAEYQADRRVFCADCHGPRGPERRAAGVDCAICHVREGAILNPTVSGRAPHPSRVEPNLAGSVACARCHQFGFERQPELPLQATVDEWMASPHRGTACQGCHMPEGSHAFAGGMDPALAAAAIAVEGTAAPDRDDTVRVTLRMRADQAGHAVPTGDVFRRLEVRVWAGPQSERRLLARRMRQSDGLWTAGEDQRIPATGERVVSVRLDGPLERVHYEVRLFRTSPARAARQGWRDMSRTLARGRLRVSSPQNGAPPDGRVR
ncbi:MAG: hypothetical protein AB8I08_17575 [Sandaracinaceae bacterium]